MHIYVCVCARTWVQVLTKARRGRPRIPCCPLQVAVSLSMWVLRRAVCTLGHRGISLAPTHAYFKAGTLKGVLVLLRLEMSFSAFSAFVLLRARTFLPSSSFYFPSYPEKSKICIRVSFGCSRAHGTFCTHSWSLSLFTELCLKYNISWVPHASHGQVLGAAAFQELSESRCPEPGTAAGALLEAASRHTGGWCCLAEEGQLPASECKWGLADWRGKKGAGLREEVAEMLLIDWPCTGSGFSNRVSHIV